MPEFGTLAPRPLDALRGFLAPPVDERGQPMRVGNILPFALSPNSGEFQVALPGMAREALGGLINLMEAGRTATSPEDISPRDALSVPLAGGVFGSLAGPRGVALAAGGTRNPIGRQMARERSALREDVFQRRQAGESVDQFGEPIPFTMRGRQMQQAQRAEQQSERFQRAVDFATAKAREGGPDADVFLNVVNRMNDLSIAGKHREANRLMAALEGLRGRTFRGKNLPPEALP